MLTREEPALRRQELPIRAEPTALRTARGFADAAAVDLGLDDDARFRFTLAANEAVANAIEHGAPRADGTVLLCISSDEDSLCFEVHDCGGFGVDWSEPDPLSERGRGLPLMAALVDHVDLTPGPDGTVVRLVLAVD
jgi:anti-sigma regulatory factor (Ser/Thr protein kinase)